MQCRIAKKSSKIFLNCRTWASGPIATSILRYGHPHIWEYCVNDFVWLVWKELESGILPEEAITVATQIIQDKWKIVQAIADALVKTKKLTHEECLEIGNRIDPNTRIVYL